MSPRGGGGGSSGGGGRSGGGLVSSTSGSKSGSMSGSSSKGSSSSGSGGTKGNKGSSSKGGSSSYSGGRKGGKVPKGSVGGKAGNYHYIAPTDACTSAAIPSRNNPFSLITRRAIFKPQDQIQYMIGDKEQRPAAHQESHLSGFESAGCGNPMDAAQGMPICDPTGICQSPHKFSGEVNTLCGKEPCDFDALIGIICFVLILIILLGEACHFFLGRKERKRPGKSQEFAKSTDKPAPKVIEVEDMGFSDFTHAKCEASVFEEAESYSVEIMAGSVWDEKSAFGPE
ncbi:MAG: hypothetical protein Q9213_006283 [Squamulea squamosa]